MPYLGFKLKRDIPIDREGAIFDLTFNPENAMNAKCSCKVMKIREAKSIESEIAGDFVGTGELTFEPADGKTKVQTRFKIGTNKPLLSFIFLFVNFRRRNSENMQQGFKALDRYLSKKYD
jgi:hypothetical protein